MALNKPYILSEQPNYMSTSALDDTNSLTDGIYTKGRFGAQETTVG